MTLIRHPLAAIAGAAVAAAVLTLASCSSSGGGGTSAAGGATGASVSASAPASTVGSASAPASTAGSTIMIKSFAYSGDLTVKAGAKVTVMNMDSTAHTLTDKATHKFDTGNVPAGGTGTFTAPSKAGKYKFGCNYHPEMAGTLTVTG